jgi:hypothetical protein
LTVPSARFFCDAGSGAILCTDTPVGPGQLAISQQPRHIVELALSARPRPVAGSSNQAVRAALARLRAELGPVRQIQDKFTELHEGPDLDRYLAAPAGFRRRPTRA